MRPASAGSLRCCDAASGALLEGSARILKSNIADNSRATFVCTVFPDVDTSLARLSIRTVAKLVEVQVALGPVTEIRHIAGLTDHRHVELVTELELLVLF